MKFVSAFLAATATCGVAGAQDSGLRWSLSTGPTIALTGVRRICANCQFYATPDSRFISGAQHGKYHAAISASRRLTNTSLVVRAEVLYNLSESPLYPGRLSPIIFGDDTIVSSSWQSAPRDEVWAGTLGLQWEALPGKAVSPYVLTSVGYALNRLQWNSDPESRALDAQEDAAGPVASFGGGIRARAGRHEMFLEWRRYRSFNLPGSSPMPFSLGFRF